MATLTLLIYLVVLFTLWSTAYSIPQLYINNPYSNGNPGQPAKMNTAEKLKRLSAGPKPNFIIFFADDLGYGDLGYNGHPTIRTPNVDYYALSGMRLSTWYSGFHVCSPSRAAMLTGRLCVRSGTCGGWTGGVFGNGAKGGLPTNETTFATILRKAGYRTKAIGKWHLGVLPQYMPLQRGFDEYLGIPYSVDMGCSTWNPCTSGNILPLIKDNSTVHEQPVDLSQLSANYLDAATSFINKSVSENKPFVLYFPMSHVHVPDYLSPAYCNKSIRGFFGGAVEEMDQLIGDVMQFVKTSGVEKDTAIFFTSDNGPWMTQRLAGGSAALFRGAKENTWEGGVREPAFAYWPGMIDSNTRSMEITTTYDIFMTIITIANATEYIPNDGRIYDGKDMSDIIFNLNGGKSKHECIYYWGGMPNDTSCPFNTSSPQYGQCQGLWAVRCGEYKAHWVTRQPNNSHALEDPPLLYNLNWDPSELHPIWPNNEAYPSIMANLTNAKWKHLSTIKKVENQIEKGNTAANWFCGDPHSQQKYPNYPNCTSNPENWEAFVCNPVCLDFDRCGTSYPG